MSNSKKLIASLNAYEIKLNFSNHNFFIIQDSLQFNNYNISELIFFKNSSKLLITKTKLKYNFNFFSKLKLKYPCCIIYLNNHSIFNSYFSEYLLKKNSNTFLTVKVFNLIFYKIDFLNNICFSFFILFFSFVISLNFSYYNLIYFWNYFFFKLFFFKLLNNNL